MSKTYDKVVSKIISEFDGNHPPYTRLNKQLMCCLTSIKPGSASKVAFALMEECLVKVHKFDKNSTGDDDPQFGFYGQGRWSKPFTAESLQYNALADMGTNEISSSLRKLFKDKLFYPFAVHLGRRGISVISTYNRYVHTSSIFWHKEIKSKQGFFTPNVPRMIAALSIPDSYYNAVKRQTDSVYPRMRDCDGWTTRDIVESKIKDAFCGFMWYVIQESDEKVKKCFIPYSSSVDNPDEYIKSVHETSKNLPPYDGIPMTREFLNRLLLPKRIIDEMILMINNDDNSEDEHNSDHEIHLCKSHNQTSDHKEVHLCKSHSQTEVHLCKSHSQTDVHLCKSHSQSSPKTTSKPLKINGLNTLEKSPYINNTTIETNSNSFVKHSGHMNERNGLQLESSNHDETRVEVLVDSEYNNDMNDISEDNNLPIELLAHERPVRSSPKPTKRSPEEKTALDMFGEISKDFQIINKRREKNASENILNSAAKLVKEFHKTVKATIPSVQFSKNEASHIDDYRQAQRVIDELVKRNALNEGIMRSWIRHTISMYKGRTYFKVGLMLSSLRSFERQIPPPENSINDEKVVVSPKSNSVMKSLEGTFSSGINDTRVSYACQIWGLRIVATYLEKMLDREDARNIVVSVVQSVPSVYARDIFGSTMKYDSVTSELSMDDWQTVFKELISKVGKIESFSASKMETDSVKAFVKTCGRKL